MQLLSDNLIVTPRTAFIGRDKIPDFIESKEMIAFDFDVILKPIELINASKTLGYPDLWNAAKIYFIERRTEDDLFFGFYLGTLKYDFAEIQGKINDVWDSLKKLANSTGKTLSGFFDMNNYKFVVLDETSISMKSDAVVYRDIYLNSLKPNNDKQVFQFYDDQIVFKQEVEKDTVTLPIFNDLANLFYDPEKQQYIEDYINANAILHLHSDFDPNGTNFLFAHKEYASSPVVVNTNQMLFRMVPAFEPRPGFSLEIAKRGTQIFNVVNTPAAYTLEDMSFKTDGEVTLIAMRSMFEAAPYFFGITYHNIIPYISNSNYTCLYWPNIKVINNIDGTTHVSFNDNIYFFDSNKILSF